MSTFRYLTDKPHPYPFLQLKNNPDMKQFIEIGLLDRLRSKEKAAMKQFIEEYAPGLFLIISFVVEDKHHAEIVLHKSLQLVFNQIDKYDVEKERFIIWLLGCTIPLIDIDREIIVEKFQLLIKSFD